MAALIGQTGALAGRRIEVTEEITLGRENATVVLDDPEVSRRHAVIRPRDGGLEVEDLASTNGTYVNGQRISVPTPLTPGDQLRLGDTVLQVPPAERPSAPGPAGAPQTAVAGAPQTPAASPPPAAPPPAAPTPSPQPAAQPFQPVAAPPPQTFGAPGFAQRRRAPATRSLAHVYWTFGVIGATALLLIVYFAARSL
jgi:hypothetical protein